MKPTMHWLLTGIAAGALWAAPPASAFNSGSTGENGALAPTGTGTFFVDLPETGVLKYTTISIPQNLTVKFRRNTSNTPVVLLVQGSVSIAGTLDVGGDPGPGAGSASGGGLADDGQPGKGGPGGYDGGWGGAKGSAYGGQGVGPGGGLPGLLIGCANISSQPVAFGGNGAGYSTVGGIGGFDPLSCNGQNIPHGGGAVYGSAQLLPLIGGSGGGGGAGGFNFIGAGGGGGGGALLIAASGSVTVTNTGAIRANGGKGGNVGGLGAGTAGGGGSGGSIRIIATTVSMVGQVQALGGAAGQNEFDVGSRAYNYAGASGGSGRIRLEADATPSTGNTNPTASVATAGPISISGLPTLSIVKVGGLAVPALPTGTRDVVLPASTTNPVTIDLQTTGVPAGNTVLLTVTPQNALAYSKRSVALVGDSILATGSLTIDLPDGQSVLSASTTYQIVVGMGESLSRYAQGERVERVRLSATLGGTSQITLITVSGKEYELPPAAWAELLGAS